MTSRYEALVQAENAAEAAGGYARLMAKVLAEAKEIGVAVFVRLNDAEELVELRTLEIEVYARRGRAVIGKAAS